MIISYSVLNIRLILPLYSQIEIPNQYKYRCFTMVYNTKPSHFW